MHADQNECAFFRNECAFFRTGFSLCGYQGTGFSRAVSDKKKWALAPDLVKRTRWSLPGNQSPTCRKTGVLLLTGNSARCCNSGTTSVPISNKAAHSQNSTSVWAASG